LFNVVRDDYSKPVHYVCVSRDITALKQNEQQLQKLAFYDSLTGLPNRTLFKDRLSVALAGAAGQNAALAVMYVDLESFKYVKDTRGHPAGDRLLVEVGQRITQCLRSCDTLARMGGDEFTVLVTHGRYRCRRRTHCRTNRRSGWATCPVGRRAGVRRCQRRHHLLPEGRR
jgi:GGDEF domain-containing protein